MKTIKKLNTRVCFFADYKYWENIILYNPPFIPSVGDSFGVDESDYPVQFDILELAEKITGNFCRIKKVDYEITKEGWRIMIDIYCGENESIFDLFPKKD